MDDVVPICCFCSKIRDDKGMELGQGPWVDLSIYANSRQLPLDHEFVFSHGYCSDCAAHYDERMAVYRVKSFGESLREQCLSLLAEAGGGQCGENRL